MIPMPSESEKNDCPKAERNVEPLSLLKSGWKRNESPSPAPSSVMERMAKTMSRRKSTGMSSLADFSMPFLTPELTNTPVSMAKVAISATCIGKLAARLLKSPA